jgi:hypothetical protein
MVTWLSNQKTITASKEIKQVVCCIKSDRYNHHAYSSFLKFYLSYVFNMILPFSAVDHVPHAYINTHNWSLHSLIPYILCTVLDYEIDCEP